MRNEWVSVGTCSAKNTNILLVVTNAENSTSLEWGAATQHILSSPLAGSVCTCMTGRSENGRLLGESAVGFTVHTFYTAQAQLASPVPFGARFAHFAMCCFRSLTEKWEENFFGGPFLMMYF